MKLLIFEYEKYAKTLGTYELLDYLKKMVIQVNPSQEEIDICATFFPDSEISDIVHAAKCLYADAILITNDNYFNKIRAAKIIEVWSNPKPSEDFLIGSATMRILNDGIQKYLFNDIRTRSGE